MIEYEAIFPSWKQFFPERAVLGRAEHREFRQTRNTIEEASRDTNISIEEMLISWSDVEDE